VKPQTPTSHLPHGTFWRFLIISAVIAVATAAVAMAVAWVIGRNIVHGIQEEGSLSVLRSAVDLVGRTRIADEQTRTFYMEQRREALRSTNGYTASVLATYDRQVRENGRNEAEARATALTRLAEVAKSLPHLTMVLDGRGQVVCHPDPARLGTPLLDFRDGEGQLVFRRLMEEARRARPGQSVFGLYPAINPGTLVLELKLVAAQYFAPWDLTVCADMFMGDLEQDLAPRRLANLAELRARIQEIMVAKSGYILVMDENGAFISHPVLTGHSARRLKDPVTGRSMEDLFNEAAERPFGENSFRYRWERPDDRGDFSHEKIAWCVREPTTGWLVAATAYVEDVEAELPRLALSIFLPALGAILVLAGALALLFKNLLKPVRDLITVCLAVSRGELEVMAPEDVPGEMGFLSRHFNFMIRRLRGLRRKEERRRLDLEALNRELEKVVDVRTRALKRKAQNLEDVNRRLKELDRMKSAFLSSVSHELRTPLTSVLGFAKLISRDFANNFLPLAQGQDRLTQRGRRILDNLEIIRSEGERLTRLINDVLDLNKIESGRVDWRDAETDLALVVERAVAAVRGVFDENPALTLSVHVEGDLPLLRLDFDRMVQVFLNLLHNAAKFTPQGRVTVRVFRREGVIRAEVEDTGVGVPAADHERIFDKFHQVRLGDTLREKPQGTGLGLAICRQIVERHNGRIWVESEQGRGSTFILEIPIAAAPRPAEPAPEIVAEPAPRADKALVLVADDEPAVNAYLTQLLEAQDLEVVQAFDGESAVKKAGAYQPDLVVMDIMMPGMDGRTAIALLRRDPRTAGIPVMVVSALPDLAGMGGDAALQKPVDETAFIEAVNCLLNRGGTGRPVLALRRNGEMVPGPFFALCPAESIVHCDETELWRRIESGFEGTVLLPDWAVERLDMRRLSSAKGIHVLILPERGPGESKKS
jgi:signal transduction histidine kinase